MFEQLFKEAEDATFGGWGNGCGMGSFACSAAWAGSSCEPVDAVQFGQLTDAQEGLLILNGGVLVEFSHCQEASIQEVFQESCSNCEVEVWV